MRFVAAKKVYDLFDLFVDEFLLKGNSILTEHKGVLTSNSVHNCIDCYITNFKEGRSSFDEKIIEQFKNADICAKLVFAHAEWLWAFAVDNKKPSRKKAYTERTTGLPGVIEDKYPNGFGSGGTWHNQNKYSEIVFNLLLIDFIKSKVDANEIKSKQEILLWVENICLYKKYGQESKEYQLKDDFKGKLPNKTLAACNILLHVVNPEKYERIVSDGQKSVIVSVFDGILDEAERSTGNTDERILLIRNQIAAITDDKEFDFYDKYNDLWNFKSSNEDFTELQALQYKKSIVLYGPPGTGKTFSANKLAELLIRRHLLSKRGNLKKYLNVKDDFFKDKIHHIQLHTNYNYEDFIVGIKLVNHETVPIKGSFLKICEEVRNEEDGNMPHVVILDEINRVDLSRLFGEAFSAIENRGKPIDLPIGGYQLIIPSNLYIIGTMNEIDFSLERIDFALRRRFFWYSYGFDSDKLRDIIKMKNIKYKTNLYDEEINQFVKNAILLNSAISSMPELGELYQIGHTFFAEIVDIFNAHKQIGGLKKSSRGQIFKSGAVEKLWQVSIFPILSAFLGNLDQNQKKNRLKEFYKIYSKNEK